MCDSGEQRGSSECTLGHRIFSVARACPIFTLLKWDRHTGRWQKAQEWNQGSVRAVTCSTSQRSWPQPYPLQGMSGGNGDSGRERQVVIGRKWQTDRQMERDKRMMVKDSACWKRWGRGSRCARELKTRGAKSVWISFLPVCLWRTAKVSLRQRISCLPAKICAYPLPTCHPFIINLLISSGWTLHFQKDFIPPGVLRRVQAGRAHATVHAKAHIHLNGVQGKVWFILVLREKEGHIFFGLGSTSCFCKGTSINTGHMRSKCTHTSKELEPKTPVLLMAM